MKLSEVNEIAREIAQYDKSAPRELAEAMVREVRRLHREPVIPSCRECVRYYPSGRSCEHPDAIKPGEARHVEPEKTPPKWCPWRKRGSR